MSGGVPLYSTPSMPYVCRTTQTGFGMPRKARDERLDTRTARLKLSPRAEPYWRNIQGGRALGYRRVSGGRSGTWIARHHEQSEGRRYSALGAADDLMEADGSRTLSFSQAQDKAREWFQKIERNGGRVVERVTVSDAMARYVIDYTTRGGKALKDLQTAINAHVLPALEDKYVDALTAAIVKAWHHKLADSPARLRTKASAKQRNTRALSADDADGRRARRSTANRLLTILKAGLSLAYREGQTPSDDAWRRVKPFPNADSARIRYLTDAEGRRLVNSCGNDTRRLVTAALLTGCRYAELGSLTAGDLDTEAAVLHIRHTKAGKPRSVPLTADAEKFFAPLIAGKQRSALILARDDGSAWGRSHQFRPLREACAAASIFPAVSFHILRHTFASRLAMRGVPMAVVAAALGNTETMCARHYAHLAPAYIADTIRKHAGGMGLGQGSNITALKLA